MRMHVLAYLDDVCLRGSAPDVEKAFIRFSELHNSVGLYMSTKKCQVWSCRDPADARTISESLGMKFSDQGFVAWGFPLGSDAFVQTEANSNANHTAQLIKRVLDLPLSAQDRQLLLRRSPQSRILQL